MSNTPKQDDPTHPEIKPKQDDPASEIKPKQNAATSRSTPDSPLSALWQIIWESPWRIPATIVIILGISVFAVWSSLPDDRKGRIIALLLGSDECEALKGQLVSALPDSGPNQCKASQQGERQSVETLYLKANPVFAGFTGRLLTGQIDLEKAARVSLVLAPAGMGKSFIFRELTKRHTNLRVYKLTGCNYKSTKVPTLKPDADSGLVLGSHPKFELPRDQTLVQFLNACRGAGRSSQQSPLSSPSTDSMRFTEKPPAT